MLRTTLRKCWIVGAALVAFGAIGLGGAERAEAQYSRFSVGYSYDPTYGPVYGSYARQYGGFYSGHRHYHRSAPIYHPPSVHYHRVYHPEYTHWTPRRGVHTHGHYDYVPHYVPGHFDRLHGNHIDLNPHFHD